MVGFQTVELLTYKHRVDDLTFCLVSIFCQSLPSGPFALQSLNQDDYWEGSTAKDSRVSRRYSRRVDSVAIVKKVVIVRGRITECLQIWVFVQCQKHRPQTKFKDHP